MRLAEELGIFFRTGQRLFRRRSVLASDRPYQQLLALRVIARENVRTQAALAELLVIDAPATCRLVQRLEEDGLVIRSPGEDRRCIRLDVTPKAARELEATDRAVDWIEEKVNRLLSPEEARTFLELVTRLHRGLSAFDPAHDP